MQPDVVTARPLNAETPWAGLVPSVTPAEALFVRDHFDAPRLDPATYHLRLVGESERPKAFTLPQLQAMPHRKLTAVMECAGNARKRLDPRPPGVPWGDRAVGCVAWEGPALADVLRASPPARETVEVVFRGADLGIDGDMPAQYERSLPVDVALGEGPLLALRLNGQALPKPHGAPVRLVVPGWYGMASVKWLTDIRYTTRPFTGWFQSTRYCYDDGTPVTEVRPRALLLRPHPGEPLRAGRVRLEGRAWGAGGVAEVVARIDGGEWQPCRLEAADNPFAWRAWSLDAELAQGTRRVAVRARDARGRWQPLEAAPTKVGYGNNAVAEADLLVGP